MGKFVSIRNFAFSLMAILMATLTTRAENVSVDDAFNLVSSQITENEADYYICENYDNEDALWLFFVDAEPTKAWAHDCYLVSVPKNCDIKDVSVEKEKLRFPPNLEKRPYKVKKRMAQNLKKSKALTSTSLGIKPPVTQGKIYALIINGGKSVEVNTEYEWNDCSYIYRTLRNTFSVPKENIEVLISDGFNPFPDMVNFDDETVSSDPDLDGDGEDDITGAALKEDIRQAVLRLSNKISDNDMFFLFITGSSEYNAASSEVSIYLWNDIFSSTYNPNNLNKINNTDLVELLTPVLEKNCLKNIVLSYGYSGNYPEEFKKDGIFVTTACGKKQQKTRSYDYPCTDFSYLWTSAINQIDWYGNATGADYDGDGYVSMIEAYNNVFARRKFKDNPQYYCNSLPLSKTMNLGYILSSEELYIADDDSQNISLKYVTASENAWNSPDIWISNGSSTTPGENEIPQGQQVYINVRIHNASWKSGPTNYKLMLGWSFNTLGLTDGEFVDNQTISGYPIGGLLEDVSVPKIPPFSSTIVRIPWLLPDKLYSAILDPDFPLNDIELFAQLAIRRNTPSVHIKTYGLHDIAKLSRKTAMKNILFQYPAFKNNRGYTTSGFLLKNPSGKAKKYNLSLRTDGSSEASTKLIFSNLELKMPINIYNKWVQNGGDVESVRWTDSEYAYFRIDMDSTIPSIPLDPNQMAVFGINTGSNFLNPDDDFRFDLILSEEGGTVYDGMHVIVPYYQFQNPLSSEPLQGNKQAFSNKESILNSRMLMAELNNEVEPNNKTLINVTDMLTATTVKSIEVISGEKVCNIDLSNLADGLYMINLVENGVSIDSTKIHLN